jgi:hypothetical protein
MQKGVKMKLTKCTIFTTEEELQYLTGLNHNELWDKGFDLDDWDIGFCTNRVLKERWLLNQMKNYCCEYKIVNYQGFYYYIVYHA